MKRLLLRKNLSEESPHGDYGFPFFLSHEILSEYEHASFEIHWHPELEFTAVLEGAMEYQANDTVYRLTKGDGMFVNANVLHTAKSYDGQDCSYLVVTFNPVLIFGHENSTVESAYVRPVLQSRNCSSFYLNPGIGPQNRIIRLIREIGRVDLQNENCRELEIKIRLCKMWVLLYGELQGLLSEKDMAGSKDILYLKQTLDYLHSHYQEKLTLDSLAASCNISKSRYCHFFKKTMRQTPFEYLIKYRIEKSIPLLLSGDCNITEISEKVGFSGASYYSENFKKYMNCSPSEYRKIHAS
ncbi:AraC family transcriptional regulator [Caproiciproducens faecalis]|uniref:Helix-turn-helix transcriptional regulator n=1 Tax=Caproiciproducens faecalis TaxID=2820301 RepID=A0ABS7DPU2_9FIRM|nr:AraC family transcriptional regulator [Caproiciproducens faecalis]MBW7573218.1 helix-turn-helix transcriptional regulator [Caproiciproducens faecalis]